jgi:hypothetical protein
MLSKSCLKYFAAVGSSLGLVTINCLSSSLPAQAALPCKGGTVNYFPNGSVESCTIENYVDIATGSLAFSCKQGYSIFFDEKANFKSCVISNTMTIRRDKAVETCPENSWVYVSIAEHGNQSISCQR